MFNKEGSFLVSAALVFTYLVFLTSNDPILPALSGTLLEPFFTNDLSSNEVLSSISTGFLVSIIFYALVVYIPNQRDKRKILPIIITKIEKAIYYSELVVDSVDQYAETKHKYKDVGHTCSNIESACNSVMLNAPLDPVFYPSVSNGAQMLAREVEARAYRKDLLTYMHHIDNAVMKELIELDHTHLHALLSTMVGVNANSNFGFLAPSIYEYHTQLGKLVSIYKETVNPKYKNERYN